MFDINNKNNLPTLNKQYFIYQFVCVCNKTYLSRTGKILLNRINKHLPKSLLNKIRIGNNHRKIHEKIYSNSVIGEHLVDNPDCFKNYDLNKFKVILKIKTEFHLKTSEAIYILSKNAELYKRNKFVYSTIFFSSFN